YIILLPSITCTLNTLHYFPTRRSSDLDDDVLHAERHHGELDGRRHAAVHLAIGRHDVADVTGDEQIARRALGDQLGNDPRIGTGDRKSTRLNSSHVKISYAVFCLKKKI